MRESELLRHIYARSRGLPTPIEVGPGDDAAVIRLGGDEPILATVDQLVEGRHYDPAITTLEHIARKGVARSVSDIAAMGGRPTAGLATAALRDGFDDADALFDSMARWARSWNAPLAGGDIATIDGPTVLTVSIFGRSHPVRGPVLRSGARPGDVLFVTGSVGGSFASGRHLTFAPRIEEGHWLCETLGEDLRAMIDLSDGLGRDAARLAAASGVRVTIDAERAPLSPRVTDRMDAIGEGEDYELLFAVSPDAAERMPARCPGVDTPITRLGTVEEGEGCIVRTRRGDLIDAAELGWDHAS